MYVDEARAKAKGLIVERAGTTYYFCSADCLKKLSKPGAANGVAVPSAAKKPSPGTPGVPQPVPAGAAPAHDGGGHH
jgi:YHS domain-containing protein